MFVEGVLLSCLSLLEEDNYTLLWVFLFTIYDFFIFSYICREREMERPHSAVPGEIKRLNKETRAQPSQ